MRKPFVAGNWKMNKTVKESLALVTELLPGLEVVVGVECVVCPPFTALFAVSTLLSGTKIGLGAQDVFSEPSGAFTGEISPGMLKELCSYVIIGHSERREHFCETDQSVNRKVKSAITQGLIPIVCVGETLDQNRARQTAGVVIRQVREGLLGIPRESAAAIVIAYEPVWAIGTGLAATGNGANEVAGEMIRATLASMFGENIAQAIRILYGGSVKPENAAEFFGQTEIDGALVGGASLKASDFVAIVQAASR